MATKKPRLNKTKEELLAFAKHKAKMERQRTLVKMLWPFIQDQKTIYDAQTVVAATAGFIKQELDTKINSIVVKELTVDLSKEKDAVIKNAIENLLGLFQTESAEDASALLQKVAEYLGTYSAKKYMENKMEVIALDDFVA